MGQRKAMYTVYKPLHKAARFWWYSEACYTDAELDFRLWALNARAHSGIAPEYLANPSSWFSLDEQQALINIHEKSWFYANAYRTRHVLTQDDFFVQPVDAQRLQWPSLYYLMQKTGDYLILRNQNLPSEHLNQPMNFLLLDMNHMLRGLSQNPNIKQTQEQLELLTRYARVLEKQISPLIGSDRLFIANLRSMLDEEVQPQLSHLRESLLLRDRLGELFKNIQQLASERHRILHFALSRNRVNPHPNNSVHEPLEDLKAYPLLAAMRCAQRSSTAVQTPQLTPLKFSAEQVRFCPDLELVTADAEVLHDYGNAISDLNNLAQFQNIISQVIELLGQAGEVYTVYQFKEQLVLLLEQIEQFIDESSRSLEGVMQANNLAYHQAIHEEQNLSFFKKLVLSEHERLSTFIKNQDTLAQFPSTNSELLKTKDELKKGINQVIRHLNRPISKKTNFSNLARQANELNALMGSMHGWVRIQYEARGLKAPPGPDKLVLATPVIAEQPLAHGKASACFFASSKENQTVVDTASRIHPNQTFCGVNSIACPAAEQKSMPAIYILGLITLIPVVVITLYLLFRAAPQIEKPSSGAKDDFDALIIQIDDLLAQKKDILAEQDNYIQGVFSDFCEYYQKLKRTAQSGQYAVHELKNLFNELQFFFADYEEEQENAAVIKAPM